MYSSIELMVVSYSLYNLSMCAVVDVIVSPQAASNRALRALLTSVMSGSSLSGVGVGAETG